MWQIWLNRIEVLKMGANRAMRRQAERDQIRAWKSQGRYGQVMSLQRNGIQEKDLDAAYKNGYEEGYKYASSAFFKLMYAAIAKELHTAGNSKDDIIDFLVAVDHRVAVMFDADEEIEDVYRLIGVRMNVDKNELDRIEVLS
jgi:hypothetical protein